jgi:hypothetical protein
LDATNYIQTDDFLKFLKNGMPIGAVSIGMNTHEIKEIYGEPTSVTGNDEMGYFFYKELRLGFWKDKIDEIAIIFDKDFVSFSFYTEFSGSIQSINSSTKLNEVFLILNFLEINWKSAYDQNNREYLFIETSDKVWITFNLEENRIAKISYTGLP